MSATADSRCEESRYEARAPGEKANSALSVRPDPNTTEAGKNLFVDNVGSWVIF